MHNLFINNSFVHGDYAYLRMSSNLCCLLQADAAPAQAADALPAAPIGDESEEEIEVTEKAASQQQTTNSYLVKCLRHYDSKIHLLCFTKLFS